jgi:hypothetical protein
MNSKGPLFYWIVLMFFQFNSFSQGIKDSTRDFYQILSPDSNQIITSPLKIIIIIKGFMKDNFISVEIMDNSDHELGGKGIHLSKEELPENGEFEVNYNKPFCQQGKIKFTRCFPTEGFKPTKAILGSSTAKEVAVIPVIFSEKPDSSKCPNLLFENYPVPDIYGGKIANVNFNSYPAAREYRTRIKEAIDKGVNFAGHFTIANWGCGTSCIQFAIIDDISGRILVFDTDYHCGLDFKKNSRLLIKRDNCEWADSVSFNETYCDFKNNQLLTICSY